MIEISRNFMIKVIKELYVKKWDYSLEKCQKQFGGKMYSIPFSPVKSNSNSVLLPLFNFLSIKINMLT